MRNTVLSFTIMGAVIAGGFGLAAGLMSQSPRPALVGLVVGMVLGAVLGAAGGRLNALLDQQLKAYEDIDATIRTVCAHVAGWLLVGFATGVAAWMAAPKRPLSHFLAATGIAGILSGMLYCPSAVFLFPIAQPEDMLPEGRGNRLYWILLTTTLLALTLYSLWQSAQAKQKTAPT